MASPLNETREPEWKKAWTGNTLLSAPPLPLFAIVGIVVFLLWVSSQINNYSAMQIATTNVNLFLFLLLLPLVLAPIAQGTRLVLSAPKVTSLHDGDAESESSSMPWKWVVSVLMLLVLISYRLHPVFVIAIVFLYVYLLSA